MKARRDWSVLWYAAVLGAAVAWGYAPPAVTEVALEGSASQGASTDSAPASHRLELRRVAQQMILR